MGACENIKEHWMEREMKDLTQDELSILAYAMGKAYVACYNMDQAVSTVKNTNSNIEVRDDVLKAMWLQLDAWLDLHDPED